MSDAARKREAGKFFIERYQKLVGYFQRSYADLSEMEVEDAVSDMMTDLLERSEILDRVENLSAYIYRSVRNRINDYLRRRKRTLPLEEARPVEADDSPRNYRIEPTYEMTAEIEAAEIRERLVRGLDVLAPDQRAVWIATELEGRTFRELAESWETPIGTLLARKHRANASLQKALQDLKDR